MKLRLQEITVPRSSQMHYNIFVHRSLRRTLRHPLPHLNNPAQPFEQIH